MAEPIQLFVKSLNGKTRTITVNPESTIRQVKEQIQDKEGINKEDQRLIFAGKSLQDDKTVNDYNLVSNSTIHLVLHVKG